MSRGAAGPRRAKGGSWRPRGPGRPCSGGERLGTERGPGPGRGLVARAGAAPRGDLVAAWGWEVPRVAGVVGGFPFRTDKTCFLCSGWRVTGAASKNTVTCSSVISYPLVLGISGSELKALEGELLE